MIESVHHQGKFLHECPLPGETRSDLAYPAHPNGIQLSHNRFLITYTTRAYRGRDDERSAVYQLRADGWDGPVLANGFFSQTRDDWDPLGDGKHYIRQHGHPVAFGVPKGALVGGRRVPHENVFAAMWRICARWRDPASGLVVWETHHPEVTRATRGAEWLQFRLNDAEDDIEIIQPATRLRQVGYEEGPQFCEQPIPSMIKGFVPPVPLNDDCSEWVDINTVAGAESQTGKGFVMAARYRFNPARGRYEWVQAAPPIGPHLFEGSIARWNGTFIGSARKLVGNTGMNPGKDDLAVVNWWRYDDPFDGNIPELVQPADQRNWHPTSIFTGADGGIKRLGGCPDRSPTGTGRDPGYIVSIDPDRNFAVTDCHVVLQASEAKPPFPVKPYIDFLKLLPHTGGRDQVILHRIWSPNTPDPDRRARGHAEVTDAEREATGIYWAKVRYSEDLPARWAFAEQSCAAPR